MALRAVLVAGCGEANCSTVVGVAGRTGRSKCLRHLVNCTVMASQTFLVGNFLAEKSGLRDVAGRALAGQHGVRRRERAGGIDAPVSTDGVPRQPDNRERGQRQRKQKFPSSQRASPLEILEVNSLRELFGCARSWHDPSSVDLIQRASIY
jgi:hypothetical protein